MGSRRDRRFRAGEATPPKASSHQCPTSRSTAVLLSDEADGHLRRRRATTSPGRSPRTTSAGQPLEDAMAGTIVEFDDGDIVEGTVVKIDRDEVLLDIGFKSEGVIPARELSIRNDVHPDEIVSPRRPRRGARPPEGGQGRPARPLEEAGPVRAGVGDHREAEGSRRDGEGPGHRGREGRPDRRHRPARLPAGVPRRAAPGPRAPALRRPGHRGQDHRARPEPQQRRPVPPGVAGGGPEGAARRLPRQPQARRAPQGRRLLGRQLRCLRRPRRHGRPRPRLRALLEARRPPVLGRRRSATRSRSRCSTSTSTRSASASR